MEQRQEFQRPIRLRGLRLTGFARDGAAQVEPQEPYQIAGADRLVCPAMEIAKPIESADDQRQQGYEPAKEQAVGMVMADMFQTLVSFAVVEALVLDFPAALGHAI